MRTEEVNHVKTNEGRLVSVAFCDEGWDILYFELSKYYAMAVNRFRTRNMGGNCCVGLLR